MHFLGLKYLCIWFKYKIDGRKNKYPNSSPSLTGSRVQVPDTFLCRTAQLIPQLSINPCAKWLITTSFAKTNYNDFYYLYFIYFLFKADGASPDRKHLESVRSIIDPPNDVSEQSRRIGMTFIAYGGCIDANALYNFQLFPLHSFVWIHMRLDSGQSQLERRNQCREARHRHAQ